MTIPAGALYDIGDVVRYADHQKREQTGAVLRVTAEWSPWGDGAPLIIYEIEHPTYRNGRTYCGERRVLGAAS